MIINNQSIGFSGVYPLRVVVDTNPVLN